MDIVPRYDIYAPIHKALRLFMTDTLQRLSRLDVDDPQDLNAAMDQLDALLDTAASHLQHENDYVHPFLEERCRGVTGRIASEHIEHLEAIAMLRTEATALRTRAGETAAHRLYRHLAAFIAENFEHMDDEEVRHNQALWGTCDDATLQALEARILSNIDPEEMNQTMRWLIPALNPTERAQLLAGLPAEARMPVLDAARALLDEAAWGKLCQALGIAAGPDRVEACA